VKTSDWGATNGLATADTSPHLCSAGNVQSMTTGAGLQTSITEPNWYVDPPTVTLAPNA
jgi:hypothetical protein